MNELVEKLTTGQHPVEASRPEKTSKALKECIDRNYVHILFKETGTELGMKLDNELCDFKDSDFENNKGKVHLEGCLTLNYEKVKIISEIDLKTLEGKAQLELVDDVYYNKVIA